MNIFNSLGSNYDLTFVLKSILLKEGGGRARLQAFLEKKYVGKVILFYKARQAITQALILSNLPKDSEVAITGFTCIAVVDAVKEAEYSPIFLDIDSDTLNFTAQTLEKKLKTNPKIKAVIIQNTLGYPCDIEDIQTVCKKNKLVLIEDLAHSIGTVYENGIEAGIMGDFAVLSFSQDKVIDSVSGGALISKQLQVRSQSLEVRSSDPSFQDRYYPLSTFIIRATYPFGIGKIIHKALKTLLLLSNPMKNSNQDITDWHANLALEELRMLEKNLNHRKTIAKIYKENLSHQLVSKKLAIKAGFSANLRFPIFIKNREALIQKLSKSGVYVSDIWYDAAVAPKRFLEKSGYKKGECVHAEEVSKQILNLPTHKNVSEKDALAICEVINRSVNM